MASFADCTVTVDEVNSFRAHEFPGMVNRCESVGPGWAVAQGTYVRPKSSQG